MDFILFQLCLTLRSIIALESSYPDVLQVDCPSGGKWKITEQLKYNDIANVYDLVQEWHEESERDGFEPFDSLYAFDVEVSEYNKEKKKEQEKLEPVNRPVQENGDQLESEEEL